MSSPTPLGPSLLQPAVPFGVPALTSFYFYWDSCVVPHKDRKPAFANLVKMAAILSPSVKGKRVSIFIIITHSLLPHLACSFQARIPGCICTTSYGPTFVHTNWLLLTALLPGSFCKYSKFYFLKIERNVITRWFHSFLFLLDCKSLRLKCSVSHPLLPHTHHSSSSWKQRWNGKQILRFFKVFLAGFQRQNSDKKKNLSIILLFLLKNSWLLTQRPLIVILKHCWQCPRWMATSPGVWCLDGTFIPWGNK